MNPLSIPQKFRGKYRIESTRLEHWDYSSNGAYFITICTKNRKHFFGEMVDGKLTETEQSKIGMACWLDLPNHYANCILDIFVIMPNHVHGIIFIQNDDHFHNGDDDDHRDNDGNDNDDDRGNDANDYHDDRGNDVETGFKPVSTNPNPNPHKPKRYSISEIIRGFKTFTSRKINHFQNTPEKSFWQSRFHDHIIRNENELNRIRTYIINNPVKWNLDRNR